MDLERKTKIFDEEKCHFLDIIKTLENASFLLEKVLKI